MPSSTENVDDQRRLSPAAVCKRTGNKPAAFFASPGSAWRRHPAITESPKHGGNKPCSIGKTPVKRNQIAGQILFWLSFAMIVYILLAC
jgi:hypothetical protein